MVAAPNAGVERLAAGSYLSLTTFRRDGTGVATPVWASADSDRLVAWTENGSGKVKRIRNGGRVLLAPCDSRGGLQGSQIAGTARIVDDAAGFAVIESLLTCKYGLQFRLLRALALVVRRGSNRVGIEITVP